MPNKDAKSNPSKKVGFADEESAFHIPARFSLQPHLDDSKGKSKKGRTPKEPRHKKHIHHPYYEDLEEEDSEDEIDLKPHLAHKEENIVVHKKPPNLASVLTYHEEVAPGEERHFANNLDAAFSPCKILLVSLFRFPLTLTVRDDFSRQFSYSWSFRGLMFLFTAGVLCANGILISAGLGCILLNLPHQPEEGYTTNWTASGLIFTAPQSGKIKTSGQLVHKSQQELRIEELFLLQRNFVPMILLVLSLIHICTSDVSLFFRRTFIAKYFTFWDEAVEIMKMDVAKYPTSVKKYMGRIAFFYIAFVLILIAICLGRLAPVATGAPTQLVILWARPFHPPIHAWDNLHIYRWAGIFSYLYLLMCSKVYIILLLYKCKILKNAYATWNERLESVIHKGRREARKSRAEHVEKRTGFDHLFRDYVVLLDLLRGADTMFTNVIESYFGTQVFSLCFEVYYFTRGVFTSIENVTSQLISPACDVCEICVVNDHLTAIASNFLETLTGHEEFTNARKMDGLLMGVYLALSIIMLLLTTNASAQVGEVAMEGLEIIRRNGCIGRKSNDEMYFTLSIYLRYVAGFSVMFSWVTFKVFSYTGHIPTVLQGGKFVTFDRTFVVALVLTIFTYYIILSQFTPALAMLEQDKLEVIQTTKLIRHVENTVQLSSDLKVGYDTLSNFTN